MVSGTSPHFLTLLSVDETSGGNKCSNLHDRHLDRWTLSTNFNALNSLCLDWDHCMQKLSSSTSWDALRASYSLTLYAHTAARLFQRLGARLRLIEQWLNCYRQNSRENSLIKETNLSTLILCLKCLNSTKKIESWTGTLKISVIHFLKFQWSYPTYLV